eukprot:4577236-Pyramimonas_sp.AAC.1
MNVGTELEDSSNSVRPAQGVVFCYECGFHISSKRVLAMHVGKEHQRDNRMLSWAVGTVCQ